MKSKLKRTIVSTFIANNSIVHELKSKSLYILSPVMSHFYVTEYEIWAGLVRLAKLKTLDWAIKYATFEGIFYVSSALKSCIPYFLK